VTLAGAFFSVHLITGADIGPWHVLHPQVEDFTKEASMRVRRGAIAGALLWSVGVAAPSSADQLGIGFITCIGEPSCLGAAGQVSWRIFNGLHLYATPQGASEDLLDVTLDFQFEGGSLSWHWDRVPPLIAPGDATESDPFDASLVGKLTLLRFEATLPRTEFDPVYAFDPRVSFFAETNRISASTTSFPPPLNFFAEGEFQITPVPEPATLTVVGVGLAGFAGYQRRRRRRSG
jgi:PEP-CTERM motif